jgi:hypothetical protein
MEINEVALPAARFLVNASTAFDADKLGWTSANPE